jgi:hypothetical protein
MLQVDYCCADVTILYPVLPAAAPTSSLMGTTILAADPAYIQAATAANAPFAANLGGPVPKGFKPPAGLASFSFTALSGPAMLPAILNDFSLLPIAPGLTAIAANWSPLYEAAAAAAQGVAAVAPAPMLAVADAAAVPVPPVAGVSGY